MEVKFCRGCPISKLTGKRVYCKPCASKQLRKLDRFLPNGYMSLDDYYADKEKENGN